MFAWDKVARERVSACKLPILYVEDSNGCYSDLPLFLAFVRSSLSAKPWAQVISPRWKCQNKLIV